LTTIPQLPLRRSAFAVPSIRSPIARPEAQASWPGPRSAKPVASQRHNGPDGIMTYRLAEFDPAVAASFGNGPYRSSATFPEPRRTDAKDRP
jgi:hypothetical protein